MSQSALLGELTYKRLPFDYVANSEIQERIDMPNSLGPLTQQYVVFLGNIDVAFLSIDPQPDLEELIICEVFVPKTLGGRGFGTGAIQIAELIARRMGANQIHLTASSMDDRYSQSEIMNWYNNRGFRSDPTEPDQMTKILANDVTELQT